MLTEVSGDGGQCLPVKWGRGPRQPVREHHFSAVWPEPPQRAPGPEGQRGSDKCSLNSQSAVLTQQSPTTSCCLCLFFRSCHLPVAPALVSPWLSLPLNSSVLSCAALWQRWSLCVAAGSCSPTVCPRSPFSPWPPGPSTSKLGQHPGFVPRPNRFVSHPHLT